MIDALQGLKEESNPPNVVLNEEGVFVHINELVSLVQSYIVGLEVLFEGHFKLERLFGLIGLLRQLQWLHGDLLWYMVYWYYRE